MEFLEPFDRISMIFHFPNQKLVHKQGEEIDQNAAHIIKINLVSTKRGHVDHQY